MAHIRATRRTVEVVEPIDDLCNSAAGNRQPPVETRSAGIRRHRHTLQIRVLVVRQVVHVTPCQVGERSFRLGREGQKTDRTMGGTFQLDARWGFFEDHMAVGAADAERTHGPGIEHGFAVDPAGYIWIAGNHPNFGRSRVPKPPSDDMLLKFTTSGKFVMQVGRRDASRGNADIENLHEPAELAVHRQTNEIFVADGYGNRRVIVLDADSGKFKRMWGAFGNTPLDDPPECERNLVGN